jgi:nuclear transport factor 2 (NTF2) superfamily protein
MVEDAWNSRGPAKVALAYTVDSRWRNRAEFLQGREAIEAFLTRKWNRELDYPADQGSMGVPRQPHRGALRL